jgi:hypothetical protein
MTDLLQLHDLMPQSASVAALHIRPATQQAGRYEASYFHTFAESWAKIKWFIDKTRGMILGNYYTEGRSSWHTNCGIA